MAAGSVPTPVAASLLILETPSGHQRRPVAKRRHCLRRASAVEMRCGNVICTEQHGRRPHVSA
eukprot:3528121-Prymnesium_polylepis.2